MVMHRRQETRLEGLYDGIHPENAIKHLLLVKARVATPHHTTYRWSALSAMRSMAR